MVHYREPRKPTESAQHVTSKLAALAYVQGVSDFALRRIGNHTKQCLVSLCHAARAALQCTAAQPFGTFTPQSTPERAWLFAVEFEFYHVAWKVLSACMASLVREDSAIVAGGAWLSIFAEPCPHTERQRSGAVWQLAHHRCATAPF